MQPISNSLMRKKDAVMASFFLQSDIFRPSLVFCGVTLADDGRAVH